MYLWLVLSVRKNGILGKMLDHVFYLFLATSMTQRLVPWVLDEAVQGSISCRINLGKETVKLLTDFKKGKVPILPFNCFVVV